MDIKMYLKTKKLGNTFKVSIKQLLDYKSISSLKIKCRQFILTRSILLTFYRYEINVFAVFFIKTYNLNDSDNLPSLILFVGIIDVGRFLI